MPANSFRLYPKRNLVLIDWSFTPSIPDLYDLLERVTGHPDYQRGMNFLTCRCGGRTPVTPDYVRSVLGVLEARSSYIGPASVAVVAFAPSDFGMARMMETLSETASVVVRAFRRPSDAMEWLKNPVPFAHARRLAVA